MNPPIHAERQLQEVARVVANMLQTTGLNTEESKILRAYVSVNVFTFLLCCLEKSWLFLLLS
jgi:hypothetical protein